jgi:hypothetical protein
MHWPKNVLAVATQTPNDTTSFMAKEAERGFSLRVGLHRKFIQGLMPVACALPLCLT